MGTQAGWLQSSRPEWPAFLQTRVGWLCGLVTRTHVRLSLRGPPPDIRLLPTFGGAEVLTRKQSGHLYLPVGREKRLLWVAPDSGETWGPRVEGSTLWGSPAPVPALGPHARP